jgi:hypothetical protein
LGNEVKKSGCGCGGCGLNNNNIGKEFLQDWKSWGSWFSWGSPIGLSLGFAITLTAIGFFLYLLRISG